MNSYDWYATLIKPEWAPPAWLFGPVWTILYIIIATTFGYVFYQAIKKKIAVIVALPFALNLIFNALFTPIQFGLKNNFLAFIDIILVLVSLVVALYRIWPVNKKIVYLNLPYLLWVCFATALQISVTYLNW